MNKKLRLMTVVCALFAGQAALAQHTFPPMEPDPKPQASDLTVAQLLAKHAAARGGEQKLQGIQTMKQAGTWTSNQGASTVTLLMAPGRYLRRIEQSSGGPSFKAVDGQSTWEITPQAGIFKPTPMGAKDASRYRHLADPQGPLVNPQAKGNKIEVMGKLRWQSGQVYKLKVTFRDGGVNYFYLDAQSFLPVRVVGTLFVLQMNKEIGLEITYQDFRDVNGVKVPFVEKVSAPEAGFTQTTTWKTVEINKPLDPAAFAAPKG